jgi:hypothetical protein
MAARATREAPSLFYYYDPRDVIKISLFKTPKMYQAERMLNAEGSLVIL